MAVTLIVEPYCSDCDEFSPEIDKDQFSTFDSVYLDERIVTETRVYCKHRNRCEAMMRYLIERKPKP